MPFTTPQRLDLTAALSAAFNWQTLGQAFRDHLGQRLDLITANVGLDQVISNVLDWIEQKGWERALVRMAHEARPDQDFVTKFIENHHEFPALLLPDQREQLRVGLFSVIKTVGELRALLTPALLAQSPAFFQGAADDSAADLYVTTIIRWSDHFDRASALIDRALARFPGNPAVESQARPLLAAIGSRRPAVGGAAYTDPFDACDLDGTLLIDREPLRSAMRRVAAGSNPRVVGVGGDSKSGKTHSKYFITHIQEKAQKYDAVVVDLSEEAPAAFRPDDLIRRVVRRWGRNDLVAAISPRDPAETEARWVIDLADFLVGEVRKAQRLLVVVLDGFAHKKLPSITRELLAQLVRMASVEKYLRLVLLHYPDDILGNEPPGRIETHTISPISESDVRKFVTSYARNHGDEPPEQSVTSIVNKVFQSPAPANNEEIAQRVDRFLKQLMQP